MSVQEMIVGHISQVGFVLKQHAPEIITGVGIVASLAATAFAVAETPKAMGVKEELANHLEDIDDLKSDRDEDGNVIAGDGTKIPYTDADILKDKTHYYVKAGVDFAKVYWPAIALSTVGVICSIKGQQISLKRNAALATAYTAVSQAFAAYRDRVKDAVGEDKESDIYKGTSKVKVTNPETGKKETVKVADPDNQTSPYARWFDSSNANFSKDDHDYNVSYIESVQRMANHKLRNNGHLFLNDVYRMLGFEDTATGAVVGWIYNAPEDPNDEGDGYVDLRAEDNVTNDVEHADERAFFIDPNVDGYILNKIKD